MNHTERAFGRAEKKKKKLMIASKKKKKPLHNVVFLGFVFPFWKERAFFFFTFSKNRKEK